MESTTTLDAGDVIAVLALCTSVFGLIVPWWQAGHARLAVHFERWFDPQEGEHRYRAVVANSGSGSASGVVLYVPVADRSAEDGTELGVIHPGQSLYLELIGPRTFTPLTDGKVVWRDGRVQRERRREFIVTIKDLL